MAQPDLAPGAELGRHGAERNRQIGELAVLEGGTEDIEEALAADEAAAPGDVHKANHLGPCEARDPGFELVELPGRVHGADQRTDRGAADEVGLHAALLERADRADVRPAAGTPRAERETDAGFAGHQAREFTRGALSPFEDRRDALPTADAHGDQR